MTHNNETISLGFTRQQFRPGVHICQIYSKDEEREELLLKCILSGLQSHERTSCFSDNISRETIKKFLDDAGTPYEDFLNSGALTLSETDNVYFKNNRFDPERMLSIISKYYEDSISQGYLGARIIGEMSPKIQRVPGGDRLLEYESKISLLLHDHYVTSICQYDARNFDGAIIMDILKVHPMMIIRGTVVNNPFFIEPEAFLAQLDKEHSKGSHT